MNIFVKSTVGFFLLGACLSATLSVAQTARIDLPKRGLCAHRGCLDTHPENTLPAFREAIRLGAQMIEFDVQLTRDGVMVIMHDETVDRTTNGTGNVSGLTLVELRRLDAGVKKGPQFAGTPVPTFEETLAMMPRNVWLNCHLKGGEAVGRAAAALVAKVGRKHQAFLACGEEAAAGARRVQPDILICNAENRYRTDTKQYVAATLAIQADFIQLLRSNRTNNANEDRREAMAALKNGGVRINYYYAQTPDELPALFDSGVDFILVNNLAQCLAQCLPQLKPLGIVPVQPTF